MPARIRLLVPGLALSVLIAVVGSVVGRFVPVLGSAVPGIAIGVLLGAMIRPGDRLRPGIGFGSKRVLQASVVLLGTQLSLGAVVQVGIGALPVMIGTLAVCLAAAWLLGRALGIAGGTTTLIGVGTGICGASAIAATAPVIGAAAEEVAYAVSTIFLFNIAAVLLFPVIGHLLGMTQASFGLFAGTAVNDTSSVVRGGHDLRPGRREPRGGREAGQDARDHPDHGGARRRPQEARCRSPTRGARRRRARAVVPRRLPRRLGARHRRAHPVGRPPGARRGVDVPDRGRARRDRAVDRPAGPPTCGGGGRWRSVACCGCS